MEENKTVMDLLKAGARIQGDHTRLMVNYLGDFEVLRRKQIHNINSDYTITLYAGLDEGEAVSEFLKSEEG